jgi:hypothetical protein
MKESVLERINHLIDDCGESKNALANKCDMAPQTFGRYVNGDNKITVSLVSSLLEVFPDLSAEWLLRGEGDMYKKTTELPPVDVSSEESIEHSAEVARLVREKNELIDANEELREENKRLHAQLEVLKDVLRSSLGSDAAQKVG